MKALSKTVKRWIDMVGCTLAVLALISVAGVVAWCVYTWFFAWPGWP